MEVAVNDKPPELTPTMKLAREHSAAVDAAYEASRAYRKAPASTQAKRAEKLTWDRVQKIRTAYTRLVMSQMGFTKEHEETGCNRS